MHVWTVDNYSCISNASKFTKPSVLGLLWWSENYCLKVKEYYSLQHFKRIVRWSYMLLVFMLSNLWSQGHVLLGMKKKSTGMLCHGEHGLSIRIQKWMWHVPLHQSHLSIMKHARQKREFFNTGFCALCVSEHSCTINAKRFGNRTNTPLCQRGNESWVIVWGLRRYPLLLQHGTLGNTHKPLLSHI